MEGVLSKGILSGNGLCLEGVMYGGGFVRAPNIQCVAGTKQSSTKRHDTCRVSEMLQTCRTTLELFDDIP